VSINQTVLNLANLHAALSPERMQAYERLAAGAGLTGDARLEGALRLYAWDVRLSGAFFEEIAYLEVVLRNAIHYGLSTLHGGDDWFRHRDWFPDRTLEEIEKACERLRQRRKPITPGRVVSELNLGFWKAILGVRHDRLFWHPTNGPRAWFPGLEDSYHRRGDVADIVTELNLLRNRIAHHQSIIERDHLADHGTIVQLLGWISTDASALVSATGRVPKVVAIRPSFG
jgi:hypothetical protein